MTFFFVWLIYSVYGSHLPSHFLSGKIVEKNFVETKTKNLNNVEYVYGKYFKNEKLYMLKELNIYKLFKF